MSSACRECLARSWLLEALAGHLEPVRSRIDELLALGDDELIDAVAGADAGELRRGHRRFDVQARRDRAKQARLETICRCADSYPAALRELAAAPATLCLTGPAQRFAELVSEKPVAVVGARRASPYGLTAAASLAQGLGAAGMTVVSGMALGIDSAAHEGTLAAAGATIAVMPGGADRVYPAARRPLHRRIQESGLAISELGPGVRPRRWMFPARNRIIAALSAMTVVVQARARSGALITSRHAAELGRMVGAVPGPISSPLSVGPHRLISGGATLIAGARDVLDALYGAGMRAVAEPRRIDVGSEAAALLDALAEGFDGQTAFVRSGLETSQGLAAIAVLELAGLVRRGPGGRLELRGHPGHGLRPCEGSH